MQDKRFLEFKELLNSGSLYDCGDPKMVSLQSELIERINRYNLTPDTVEGNKERIEILKEAMGNYGEGTVVLPPVRANWGLQNVFVGKNCFFNFNTIFVDDGEITIGDYCMFGPGCQIVTATHPISPELRKRNYQYD